MDACDDWTTAHDLALLYSGLACIDRDLADEEVAAIEEPLAEWVPRSADTTTGDVMQEAAVALKQSRKSIGEAVGRVGRKMGANKRLEMLRNLLRIAQADGAVLKSEQEFLYRVATVWNMKRLGGTQGGSSALVPERSDEEWTALHELAFLFIQVGGGFGKGMTADMLCLMGKRLHEWVPEASDEAVRTTLRRALDAYVERNDEPLIRDSVEAFKAILPPVRRFLVIDDLHTIAPLEGPTGDTIRRRLRSLAEAWNITIRLGMV